MKGLFLVVVLLSLTTFVEGQKLAQLIFERSSLGLQVPPSAQQDPGRFEFLMNDKNHTAPPAFLEYEAPKEQSDYQHWALIVGMGGILTGCLYCFLKYFNPKWKLSH